MPSIKFNIKLMYTTKLFVIIYLLNGACGRLTVVPENQVALEGKQAVMKCRTNDANTSVLWKSPTNDSSPQKIFTGGRLLHSQMYQLNISLSGQYDLIINASLPFGKRYSCQEGPFGHEDGNFASAELIVLAADPKCDTSIIPDDNDVIILHQNRSLELRCTFIYQGSWTPRSQWHKYNSTSIIDDGIHQVDNGGNVTSILRIQYDVNNSRIKYVYQLMFNLSDLLPTTTSKNVPDYLYKWESPAIIMFELEEAPFTDYRIFWTVIVPATLTLVLVAILANLAIRKCARKRRRIEPDVVRESDEFQYPAHPPNSHSTCHPGPVYPVPYVRRNDLLARNEESPAFANGIYHLQTNSGQDSPIIGADGTEYARLQVTEDGRPYFPYQPVLEEREIHDTSTYAQIDHTMTPP